MANSSVLLIYTGGTIGMQTDPDSGTLVPFDFGEIYEEFPTLRQLDVDIEALPFEPIDSSNVTPELWVHLAEIIAEHYERFDGFVILHGTDTMSYSASALSYMLKNLDKPVVFTGSQIPIGVLRTDGRENLITAIEIAAAKENNGRAVVPEVSLYFQNRLFRGNRTKKISAEEFSAFASYNYPALADVGVGIHFNAKYIKRHNSRLPFGINTSVSTDVTVIKIFPGLTESVFRAMLGIKGVRGIILETYGAGNAPTTEWFIDALREVMERGVLVMNVTQCTSGSVDMDIYETGRALQKCGVINGRDITVEAAVTKMMCMLGRDYERSTLIERMSVPMRGEMGGEDESFFRA